MNMNEVIARINELARIAKERALTEEETKEREVLRREFRDQFLNNVRVQLDGIQIKEKNGDIHPLKRK